MLEVISKTCSVCKLVKNTSEFHRRSSAKDGLNSRCKACNTMLTVAWQKKNRNKANANAKKWNQANPDKLKAKRIKKYKISVEDFKSLLEAQNSACAICLVKQVDLPRSIDIDHNHSTGAVRGLLCPDCNRGLGSFKDNLDCLKRAISYLEKAHA